MHRSERTVHEQIVYRLGSTRRGVTYHDIVEGKVITHSAAEVRRDMLDGRERAARVGHSTAATVSPWSASTARAISILDVAIGLVGAVSVPLYYTSPPDDIDAILQASGARLLFIGAPQLLERLDELKTELPVISFLEQPRIREQGDGVGASSCHSERTGLEVTASPAGFGDLADAALLLRHDRPPQGRDVLVTSICAGWANACPR